jgi:hypothetical protein
MTLSRAAAIGPRIAAFVVISLTACVAHAQGRFAISEDGHEVTDSVSHLVWHRCVEGMHWEGKACSGKPATFSYAGAKKAATAIAQREGKAWRIPAREELVALLDMTTKKKPRIDSKAFPQTPAKLFWATRAGTDDDLNAWLVNFANGKVRANNGQSKFPLRLVRAGA